MMLREAAVVGIAVAMLAGCGGTTGPEPGDFGSGSGGSGAGGTTGNVAAQGNGGGAIATFDADNAGLVNDEQFSVVDGSNVGLFWAGNTAEDYVSVKFPSTGVRQIIVNTNATNSLDTRILLSEDGESFLALDRFGGDCPTFNIGLGRIRCVFPAQRILTDVRVEILQNAQTTRIYEIRALTDAFDPDA